MEFSNPEATLLEAQANNPILGNTLLLLAILLFLAILPRALRHILAQKEKTQLDRMVERFEKEELLVNAVGELNENTAQSESPAPPKDHSLAYVMNDLPASRDTQQDESTPPLPTHDEEKKAPVKIVKEGVPISHNEVEKLSSTSKKKVKLIKQELTITPGETKASLAAQLDQKSKEEEFPAGDNEETDGNWVEAEIPGLIMDLPPGAEKPENIPTFKASPKAKRQSESKISQKSSPKENQGMETKELVVESIGTKDSKLKKQEPVKMDSAPKVKNLALKSEKTNDSKKKNHVPIKTGTPELQMEISEPLPKTVEIKAPIASHKNIARKEAGQKKVKSPSAKPGKIRKTAPKVTAAPPQHEGIKSSPEKAKPKPFLLDIKYLDQEELETVDPVANEKLSDDMMDVVIARLNALQADLENQLVSESGELSASENMRKDRKQTFLPVSECAINEPSDKKEVSLEELDSFLFTSTQRKNIE
jgi:hypothetical protein